ncbi:DNA gyrase subunit A [candidate division WOR-3 bacterium]|nr:DNA gyrase subunit A [candidate division WOR-3 bacterium]
MTEGKKVFKNLEPVSIEKEVQDSYIDYAMSVNIGRAIPDVRDGLKPVHRRILYAMKEIGLHHNRPFKKSATVVGEVLGKFHPHGDAAVYDTLVRMVQDFSLRYPLLEGQGNFGSIDGDSAAAYRYTETRLGKIAAELLADIDKDTVDFVPNFDGSHKEPVVLPTKFPNLILNGSSGIGVGIATNIPPHNMNEVMNACIALVDDPEMDLKKLLKLIPGPDFPTGGIIVGTKGIKEAYATGKGQIVVESKVHIEESQKSSKEKIVIDEIPYMVNKSALIMKIADLVKEKKIEGISDIRDESDRNGLRIVIEIKKDADSRIVLNQVFKHTQLRTSFSCLMLSIVDGTPKTLPLKDMLVRFLKHRENIVKRRTQFELSEAEKRAHILEGLKKAIEEIDAVIETIKKSSDTETACKNLERKFSLTQVQAQAILDMKLAKLTSLESKKIEEEYLSLIKEIARLRAILESRQLLLNLLKDEFRQIKSTYGDKRRTQIKLDELEEVNIEDLIQEEDVVITLTKKGYIKRLLVSAYRQQARGGKGVIGTKAYSEDYIQDLYVASTHDYLLCFTDRGKLHWLRVFNIPEAARDARGRSLANILDLSKESIKNVLSVRNFENDKFVLISTKKGNVKKCSLEAFSRPQKKSIKAISLDWDDELIGAVVTNGENEILLSTRKGKAICFSEKEIRKMGRTAAGVRGIKLDNGDYVVGMVRIEKGLSEKTLIFTACENGYGKLTYDEDYPRHHRGGKGVIGINTSERNGDVVVVMALSKDDELILISQTGKVIRIPVKEIRKTGRNTQGVRLMKLEDEGKLVSAALVSKND